MNIKYNIAFWITKGLIVGDITDPLQCLVFYSLIGPCLVWGWHGGVAWVSGRCVFWRSFFAKKKVLFACVRTFLIFFSKPCAVGFALAQIANVIQRLHHPTKQHTNKVQSSSLEIRESVWHQ